MLVNWFSAIQSFLVPAKFFAYNKFHLVHLNLVSGKVADQYILEDTFSLIDYMYLLHAMDSNPVFAFQGFIHPKAYLFEYSYSKSSNLL